MVPITDMAFLNAANEARRPAVARCGLMKGTGGVRSAGGGRFRLGDMPATASRRRSARHKTQVEQIQRKIRVRGSTPENAPRIRAGMEKKEQKPELKKNQTRRCYAEKTSIFFQTTDRHPPGARRETTEVKTRKC